MFVGNQKKVCAYHTHTNMYTQVHLHLYPHMSHTYAYIQTCIHTSVYVYNDSEVACLPNLGDKVFLKVVQQVSC